VLSFPICKAWARYLPNISIFGFPLNPGPFTIKEHVIITIMAGVGASTAYAVSVAATRVSAVLTGTPLDRYHRRSEGVLQSAYPI
jgi:hypothetical protein